MGETPSEFQLKNPPTDGITAVKFGPNSSQFLLTSSWDTSVRLYDVVANHLRMKYNHPAPVLDCCFHVCLYWGVDFFHVTCKLLEVEGGSEGSPSRGGKESAPPVGKK